MPSILGRFTKQSDEVLDYDVDFEDWFTNRTDAPDSFTVSAETGITVVGSSMASTYVVRVVLSGGTDGESYKITVLLTTDAATPITKEADFVVKVKDV